MSLRQQEEGLKHQKLDQGLLITDMPPMIIGRGHPYMSLLQQEGGLKHQKLGRGLHNVEGGHLSSWKDPPDQGPRPQSLNLLTSNHPQGLQNSGPRRLNPALGFPKLSPCPTDPLTTLLLKCLGQLKLGLGRQNTSRGLWKQSQEYMKVGPKLQSMEEGHLITGKKSHKKWVKDHLMPTIILGAKLSQCTLRRTRNQFYSFQN